MLVPARRGARQLVQACGRRPRRQRLDEANEVADVCERRVSGGTEMKREGAGSRDQRLVDERDQLVGVVGLLWHAVTHRRTESAAKQLGPIRAVSTGRSPRILMQTANHAMGPAAW
ncbi:MAG: hypothetical protein MUC86_02205 [Burkholderiaceae bacterium]|nr:hypothetical protein [Burkholderiaceae bacterium]